LGPGRGARGVGARLRAVAPLAKLQGYQQRMGWTFPWASSFGSDFTAAFSVFLSEEQQRTGGTGYNYRPRSSMKDPGDAPEPVRQFAASCGTDAATYTRDLPGMSAYARGLDALWGAYQWLDRTPLGRNEPGIWWRRHDEYPEARPLTGRRRGFMVGR
jgi:predicted dithiol-disulfide oxidoreductase (DUF899 family)